MVQLVARDTGQRAVIQFLIARHVRTVGMGPRDKPEDDVSGKSLKRSGHRLSAPI